MNAETAPNLPTRTTVELKPEHRGPGRWPGSREFSTVLEEAIETWLAKQSGKNGAKEADQLRCSACLADTEVLVLIIWTGVQRGNG